MAVEVVAGPPFLVQPMRRDAVLGGVVHLAGADLDLVEVARGAEDGGVQRLVAVRLGLRDVVLDALLERRPVGVDHAEGVVAVGHRVDQHADRHEIVDHLVGQVPQRDLLVDRVQVLGATGDLDLGDAGLVERLFQRLAHPLDQLLALALAAGELLRERAVLGVLEKPEREVLELGARLPHAEAVRQRRVDLARLERNAALLVLGKVLEGAHVVQPVGQLDDHDARIARHRDQQLAVVLDLLLGARAEGQRADLGEPVHDRGDLGPELALEVGDPDVGVLDHVVQQPARDRRRIQVLLDQDARDRDAVARGRRTAPALLALVGARAELPGALDEVEVEPVGVELQRIGEPRNRGNADGRHIRRILTADGRR